MNILSHYLPFPAIISFLVLLKDKVVYLYLVVIILTQTDNGYRYVSDFLSINFWVMNNFKLKVFNACYFDHPSQFEKKLGALCL